MSNVGSETEGFVQQGSKQGPPLPLQLFPARALPRTKDRKDQKLSHGPGAVETKTVPGVKELARPDSLVERNNCEQDVKEDAPVKGKSMVKLEEAKRSQEEDIPKHEVDDIRREVEGNAAPARCGSKDYAAEMEPALATISRKGFLADESFNQASSKVVGEACGEKANEEIVAVTGDYDNAKAEGGQDHNLSEEAVLVKDFEVNAETKRATLCSPEKECLLISEKLCDAKASDATNILQLEEDRVKEDVQQAPQEGPGVTNVAILLAATSDRRRFLDAVGKGGKTVVSGENILEKEEPRIEAVFASDGKERLDSDDIVQLDVSGVRTNVRRGRDLERSSQSQCSNGRRESDACQQPSSLGSSLVGESVGSWLATTSDDLLAINTTKEEKNTGPKEPKTKSRVSFSNEVMEIITYSPAEYDRRNWEIDPASAAAEWELEKNVAKLETLQVDLERGSDGLGLAIIGLGTEPVEVGLEKLGIFVRSVTAGGVAARDGRMKVGDQIIEVNGKSLVGVTQAHAASVLRAALGTVSFLVGREKVVEVEVQVEESQTTVTPESSALEEESVLGLNLSPESSSFELEGGISLLGDISVSGEGKQVDELESGFIQEDESLAGMEEEQSHLFEGEQQSMVIIEEESGAVAPSRELQEEVKEALVLEEEEESPRNEGGEAAMMGHCCEDRR